MVAVLAQPYHGNTWQQKTAQQKQSLLWKAVTANETPGPWPSALQLAELFLESMSPTMDAVQDDLPTQVCVCQISKRSREVLGSLE